MFHLKKKVSELESHPHCKHKTLFNSSNVISEDKEDKN